MINYESPAITKRLESCYANKNKVIAEYALRNISAPIGVSEYTLSKSIPTDLKGSLPTVEEIEAELNESAKED
ncbi:hypothetical protein [Legionella bozemanae]|uniref:hypothetical protein n=1 Tax=Legionella bozemanae TaxID=447 RepID=UPI00399D3854